MSTVKTGITIPQDVLEEVEKYMKKMGIRSRSKIIAEALRLYLEERKTILVEKGIFVGSLFVVYNHERGDTIEKLIDIQHNFLENIQSVLHVHISHEKCLEIIVVHGEIEKIKQLISRVENILGVELVRFLLVEKRSP